MRILAIDHGTKRMGLAVSDDLGMVALPLETAASEPADQFLERVRQLIREKEIGLVLVGMPRNMDGSYGPAAEKVRQFVAGLQAMLPVPVETWDERLTSTQANRLLIEADVRRKDRKGKVDQTAAAIFLQSYLDRKSLE